MFLKYSNSLFYFILFFTPFVVVSSESWALMWLAMEINLMMFIPLLMNKINMSSSSSAIKYFIIQAGASMIMVVSFLLFSKVNLLNSININNEMITVSMLMKSGIPPLQFWLPQVMETMEFHDILVLLTWQKISPMFILNFYVSNFIMVVMIISSVVGSLGGINQNSMKKILAYSSMSHSSWIIMTLFLNIKMWVIYFIMYSIMLFVITDACIKLRLKKISGMEAGNLTSKSKMLILFNLLSIGGLPPFIGFLTKFLIINYTMNEFMFKVVIIIMIMMSLLSLFYYMKLSYGMMFKTPWNVKSVNIENKQGISSMAPTLTLMSSLIIPAFMVLI